MAAYCRVYDLRSPAGWDGTGISSGPNAPYRVWESLYLYLFWGLANRTYSRNFCELWSDDPVIPCGDTYQFFPDTLVKWFLTTVCKTDHPMLSDCCPAVLSVLTVCLSATLVYCGQTAGWIKMKLSTEVRRPHCVRWATLS